MSDDERGLIERAQVGERSALGVLYRQHQPAIFTYLYYRLGDQAAAMVGGNLQAFKNTDGVDIVENTIDGDLQCKENVPSPTGENNIVHGNAEDQCAHMAEPGNSTPGVTRTPGYTHAAPDRCG